MAKKSPPPQKVADLSEAESQQRYCKAVEGMKEQLTKLFGVSIQNEEDCLVAASILLDEVASGHMLESVDSEVVQTSLTHIRRSALNIQRHAA